MQRHSNAANFIYITLLAFIGFRNKHLCVQEISDRVQLKCPNSQTQENKIVVQRILF